MATPRNHYEALGITPRAATADVRSAFRRLAMVYHPDKNPDDTFAPELFKRINDAYETLKDDVKRAAYDKLIALNPIDPGYESLKQPVKTVSKKVEGPTAKRGENLRYDLEVSISKLLSGQPHIVEYRYTRLDKCTDCGGSGHDPSINAKPVACDVCSGTGLTEDRSSGMRIRQSCPECHAGFKFKKDACQICLGAGRIAKKRRIDVQVPAGTLPTTILRVAKGGHCGAWGGDFGDLLLQIKTTLPPEASLDGNNVVVRLPVDAITLITGGFIRWDATEDPVRIPAGTLPGEKIFLRRKGLPKRDSTERGDLILKIDLEWPSSLNAKQLKALGAAREMFEDLNTPEMTNATKSVASILKKS